MWSVVGGAGGDDNTRPHFTHLPSFPQRTAATADPSTSSSLLDASIAAVADLHTSTAFIVASARAARAAHASPPPTLPVIGSVGIHRVFGYRFVVTGWDATCARGPEWAASVGGDPDAPWLTALPDEGDCVALFGAPRASKYIAAANYHAAPPAARVTHRALRHFFDGWSRSLSRYVPCARLRYEYPGDAELVPDDTEAIDGDAGVLFTGEEGVVRRVRGVE